MPSWGPDLVNKLISISISVTNAQPYTVFSLIYITLF